MDAVGEETEPHRVGITLGPDVNCVANGPDLSKQSEQQNDALDIGRIAAALQQTFASCLQVNGVALKGEARLPISERKGNGGQVLPEVVFRMRDRILRQIEGGVLLPLG